MGRIRANGLSWFGDLVGRIRANGLSWLTKAVGPYPAHKVSFIALGAEIYIYDERYAGIGYPAPKKDRQSCLSQIRTWAPEYPIKSLSLRPHPRSENLGVTDAPQPREHSKTPSHHPSHATRPPPPHLPGPAQRTPT